MTEIQQNRYDQLLRRVGGLIGPGAKVADVLTELFPMFDVENMPGELLALMGTRVSLGHTSEGGIAAVNQRSQLFNPADTNTLLVVTTMWLNSNTAGSVRVGLVDTALTTANNTRAVRDSRFALGPTTIGELRNDSDAAVEPVGSIRLVLLPDTTLKIHDRNGLFILSPGFGVQVTTITNNTSLTVAYMWRERVAEPSELNF